MPGIEKRQNINPLRLKTSFRKVPLSESLSIKLKELYKSAQPTPDNLLFCFNKERPMSSGSFAKNYFEKDTVASGLFRIRLHDMRHCFGTSLARQGTPLAIIMRLMGHSNLSTTMRYINLASMDCELPSHIKNIDSVEVSKRNCSVIYLK